MHWSKKLQIVMLFWIIQCTHTSGNNNSSSLDDDQDDDAQLMKMELSKMLSSSFDFPMIELNNRSEVKNASNSKLERFPRLEYYVTGLQSFFLRLFSGNWKIRVSVQKDNYLEQLKALQVRHETYNQTMKRWRLFLSQMIKLKIGKREMIGEAKKSVIPSYPSTARPSYYDVMIMASKLYIESKDNTDAELRSGNAKPTNSIYRKALALAFLDEPRAIQFYIQEIFRLSSILMNRTRYIM